jgi:hypothetical protein
MHSPFIVSFQIHFAWFSWSTQSILTLVTQYIAHSSSLFRSIVDIVMVPVGTPPGEYVLGWRWDVEETAQVWTSCADITIVAE